ncbi:MAG: hypothetical protein M1294_03820 [Firmicutes bacterium]|jgi:hypothetical protein|nr:hypothetical protein [Bacillota bacterium]HBQ94453.1 hypothetical protein [Sulfobacillus sp.]
MIKLTTLSISLGAILVLNGAFMALNGNQSTARAQTAPDACKPGMPDNKCFPQNLKPNPHPLPVPPVTTSIPQVSKVPAGPKFLPQFSALQQQYGQINVIRVGHTWLLVGYGQSVSGSTFPPPSTPGGPIVAVDRCHRATACLNPNSPHDASQFTVIPLPDPHTPVTLEGIPGNLAIIGDGAHYGPIILDMSNEHWYASQTHINQLAKKPQSFTPLVTHKPFKGIPLPSQST